MSSHRPLVTIGIPTYNRPTSLATVVRSMIAQTYDNIEIIVSDDGDSERTKQALGPELLAKIRYEANPQRLGIYGNWNRTIELAKGELMGIFHDHDQYHPQMIERCVELFERHPRVGIVHPAVEMVAADGHRLRIVHDMEEVTPGRIFAERQVRTWYSYVSHGAMIVRSSLYRKLGHFKPEIGFAADMEMLVRFALETDIGYVREPLYGHIRRQPGDAFFDFSWERVEALMDGRRENIRRVFADRPLQLQVELSRYRMDELVRVLREIAWLRYHRRDDLVAQGLLVAKKRGGPALRAAARVVVSEAMPLATVRNLRRRLLSP